MKNCVRIISIIILIQIIGFSSACNDIVDVPSPVDQLDYAAIFSDDQTAIAAISNIYSEMSNSPGFMNGDLTFTAGVYTDELVSHQAVNSTSSVVSYYYNNVTAADGFSSGTWGAFYNYIYQANAIIRGLSESTGVSNETKDMLTGEALFMRALSHFYLTNLFGDVPLVTIIDYRDNSSPSRSSAEQVYVQIIEDLTKAIELLDWQYPSAGRARVNKGAAIALLARAYLYSGDYSNAEAQASTLIEQSSMYNLESDLDNIFLNSSREAIWQLLPGNLYDYTFDGYRLIVVSAPPPFVSLRSSVFNSFLPEDQRRHWVDSISSSSGLSKWYFPYKYKNNHIQSDGNESSVVLRMAEQYLIRAEARARQGRVLGTDGAVADVNAIRHRAGLPGTDAATREEMLDAILEERRHEFFAEYGHRFFDLRRFGKLDEVMSVVKSSWKSTGALLPIPQDELLVNPNLNPQNPGY